jgi:16S rRNA (cytosine967-C5)-methyltransferase
VAWEAAAPSIPAEARGWVHEAVFGTLRLRGRLDFLLQLHLRHGLDSVPPPLLRVLRLGAYQLAEMGSVPAYAAVSESVELAKGAAGAKGAGLVNAVLRALAAAGTGPDRFPTFDEDPVGHLATWGSHPRWLVERWASRFGVDVARTVVDAGNRIPDLYLRPIGIGLRDAAARLAAAGIEASDGPDGSRTLRLPRGTDPRAALAAVPAIVQDPAAARVVEFAAPRPGWRVADLCAAPGGKGIGMTDFGALVVGADASATRLRRMGEALRRLALPERLVVGRAESPPFRGVDLALVDAPCTGTGTLARHPDARWRLTPDAPARMAELQARILDGAAGAVRPGGLLVYATCTLEEEENDGAVNDFLARHRDFRREGDPAVLRVLPGDGGTDGAFAARLRKDS